MFASKPVLLTSSVNIAYTILAWIIRQDKYLLLILRNLT